MENQCSRSSADVAVCKPAKNSQEAMDLKLTKWSAIALHLGVDVSQCLLRYRALKQAGWTHRALSVVFTVPQFTPRGNGAAVPWEAERDSAPAKYKLNLRTLRLLDQFRRGDQCSVASTPNLTEVSPCSFLMQGVFWWMVVCLLIFFLSSF